MSVMSMLWDPLISVEDEIILNEFHSMKDGMQNGFVVVHLGVWAQKIIKQTMKESPTRGQWPYKLRSTRAVKS